MVIDPLALIIKRHETFWQSFLSGFVPLNYALYVDDRFVMQPFICINEIYRLDGNMSFSISEPRLNGIRQGINRGVIDIIMVAPITEEQIQEIITFSREYEYRREGLTNLIKEVSKKLEPF